VEQEDENTNPGVSSDQLPDPADAELAELQTPLDIWSTEEDATVRRVVLGNNKLYMYPLTISMRAAQQLFSQLAQASQALEAQPRFYNTLTSNCTNELARVANNIQPGAIPADVALVFPGFSNGLLHKLGFIRNDVSLEELRDRYYISDLLKGIYHEKEFSKAAQRKSRIWLD
jgi:Domain of unknown function (DUF4105)